MKLQAYDILSQVIPGFIIYALLQYFYPNTIPKFDTFPSFAVAYLIGFYVNLLSSFFEPFYYRMWGGKPSSVILEKDMGKIKLYHRKEIGDLLRSETKDENPENDELFSIARKVANNSTNERIQNFNSSYAASRGILTCVIIIALAAFFRYIDDWAIALFIIVLFLYVTSLRTKQRAYYYAREILESYWVLRQPPIE